MDNHITNVRLNVDRTTTNRDAVINMGSVVVERPIQTERKSYQFKALVISNNI